MPLLEGLMGPMESGRDAVFGTWDMGTYGGSAIAAVSVMVCAWVGKAFPDMRQNERGIQVTRVGDALRTASQPLS